MGRPLLAHLLETAEGISRHGLRHRQKRWLQSAIITDFAEFLPSAGNLLGCCGRGFRRPENSLCAEVGFPGNWYPAGLPQAP